MPSSRKSNIRSRWYRPNEKPLDYGSNPQKNAEPIGEISSTENLEFIDDLSNARPPKVPKKRPQNRNKNSFGKNGSSRNNRDQDRVSDSSNKEKARKHNGDKKRKLIKILLTTKALEALIITVVEKRNPKTVDILRKKRLIRTNPNQKNPSYPPLLQRFLVNELNCISCF